MCARASNYWEDFLLKHQKLPNISFHCVAFVLMYAVPVLAWAQGSFWMLIFLPMSQAIGLAGHWLFEPYPIGRRDAIFSWRVVVCLHRMFFSVIKGCYGDELMQARNNLASKKT